MPILIVGAGGAGAMAAWRLAKAGHEVTVYNRTRSKAQALAKQFAGNQLRLTAIICVEQKIEPWQQRLLQPISHAPVQEESAFVFQGGPVTHVIYTEVRHFSAPLALLNFPSCQVRVHQQMRLRNCQRRACSNDEDQSAPRISQLVCDMLQLL